MPRDRFLHSATNYAEIGQSNEVYMAGVNRRIIADVKDRTGKWAQGLYDEAWQKLTPGLLPGPDNFMVNIRHEKVLGAEPRFNKFPFWDFMITVGPFGTVDVLVDRTATKVHVFSDFRHKSKMTIDFEEGDVKLFAQSFREGEDRYLIEDASVFDRVMAGVELLEWVNDVIDLRRNPQETFQKHQ